MSAENPENNWGLFSWVSGSGQGGISVRQDCCIKTGDKVSAYPTVSLGEGVRTGSEHLRRTVETAGRVCA